MKRKQIHDKWTSRENYTYNYMVVLINGSVARVFNSHRQSISPTSEVMAYFVDKYDGQTEEK